MKAEMSKDGNTIIITIPINLRRRGGRKRIVAPSGEEGLVGLQIDDKLARLVAKAHQWLGELETGEISSIRAIAKRDLREESYVGKVLRLTLLAPDIVEMILNGSQPDTMTWKMLSRSFPVEWAEQRKMWKVS
jgi:hypothetical protein